MLTVLNTSLAKILSAVFHPLLMPTLLLGLLFLAAPSTVGVATFAPSTRLSILALVLISTFLMPSLLIYYFYRLGFVKSLELKTLPDRRLPYFTSVGIYGFATYFFGTRLGALSEIAPQIALVLGSITVSIFLVALISLRWQISAHAVGMSGVVGAITAIATRFGENALVYPLIGFLIIMGYVAAARLHLNAHTPAQIFAGLMLGFLVSVATVVLFF